MIANALVVGLSSKTSEIVTLLALAAVAGPASLATPCGWNSLMAVAAPSTFRAGIKTSSRLMLLFLFCFGQLCSASLVGLAAGELGALLRSVAPGILTWLGIAAGLAGLVYGISGLARRRIPVPTSRWRVPRDWGTFGPFWFAWLFGLALGTGFLTVVPYIGFYVFLVLSLHVSVGYSVLAMVTFAVTRLLPVLLSAALYSVASSDSYRISDRKLIWRFSNWDARVERARLIVLLASVPVVLASMAL